MNITDKIDLLLKEAYATNKVETPIATKEEAIDIIKTKCVKNFKEGQILYRGNKVLDGIAYLFTGKETRASAYTSNYSTLLFSDYLSSWSKYPKRNKALTCSTNPKKAFGYGNSKDLYWVVPFDTTTNFGVAGASDFWEIVSKNPYWKQISIEIGFPSLPNINKVFAALGNEQEFISKLKKPIKDILEELKSIDDNGLPFQDKILPRYTYLSYWYAGKSPQQAWDLSKNDQISDIPESILKTPLVTVLNKILAPDQTTVKLANSLSALKSYSDNEVWLDQPAIMLKKEVWN